MKTFCDNTRESVRPCMRQRESIHSHKILARLTVNHNRSVSTVLHASSGINTFTRNPRAINGQSQSRQSRSVSRINDCARNYFARVARTPEIFRSPRRWRKNCFARSGDDDDRIDRQPIITHTRPPRSPTRRPSRARAAPIDDDDELHSRRRRRRHRILGVFPGRSRTQGQAKWNAAAIKKYLRSECRRCHRLPPPPPPMSRLPPLSPLSSPLPPQLPTPPPPPPTTTPTPMLCSGETGSIATHSSSA